MAGSLSLSAAQRFDRNGKPLAGGKLYFYAANTSTPQNAYKDTALTLAHSNPIELDAYGNIPEFYVADGSIHIRLTDSSGVVMFESLNMLVVGPSAGTGSGTAVDATTILATGDVKLRYQTGALDGFVRGNGKTIGSSTSGATERANADCQNLFVHLWTQDINLAVSGGRGATAAADWGANKTITVPDFRSRVLAGLDDMGNAQAFRMVNAIVNSTTLGATGGIALSTLTTTELPPHTHTGTTDVATQSDTLSISTQRGAFSSGNSLSYFAADGGSGASSSGINLAATGHTHTFTTASAGTGSAFLNIPPMLLLTIFIKL